MKSLGIKAVVLGVVATTITLLTIAALFSTYSLRQDLVAFHKLLDQEIAAQHSADRVNIEFKRQVQEWKNVLIRGHQEKNRTKYWGKFQQRETSTSNEARKLRALATFNPQFRAKIEQFLVAHETMGRAYRKGFQAFVDSEFDHKVGDLSVKGIDRQPSKLLDEISTSIQAAANKRAESVNQHAESVVLVAFAITIITGILALIGSHYVLQRELLLPLRNTASTIHKLSEGHLNQNINAGGRGRGELGLLNKATFDLSAQIRMLIESLKHTSESLFKTSSELSQQSSLQIDTNKDQSIRTANAVSKLNEMSVAVEQTSTMAQTTEKMTHETLKQVEQGSQRVTDVNELMIALSENIHDADKAVSTLSERATRVDEVMHVISGIAEQTNLLALNAAIEAARAGDQGRGFAVVADEVRNLAQKTQQSTEEIGKILEDLRQGSNNSVQAMRVGQEKTDHVAEHILSVEQIWGSLSTSITQVAEHNKVINDSAYQQAAASSDINSFITELESSAVVQERQAQQQKASSTMLVELSNNLKEKISFYTL